MTDQEELTEIARMELFAGKPGFLGGLSNEQDLVRYIPEKFKTWHGNDWTRFAENIFFRGEDMSKWVWRSNDLEERKRQRACLRAALGGWDLPHEQKVMLCGWMLSEMLTEVPS